MELTEAKIIVIWDISLIVVSTSWLSNRIINIRVNAKKHSLYSLRAYAFNRELGLVRIVPKNSIPIRRIRLIFEKISNLGHIIYIATRRIEITPQYISMPESTLLVDDGAERVKSLLKLSKKEVIVSFSGGSLNI